MGKAGVQDVYPRNGLRAVPLVGKEKPAAHCSLGHRDVAEQSGRKKRFGLAALFPKSQTGSVTCSGKGNVVEYPWARSVPKP